MAWLSCRGVGWYGTHIAQTSATLEHTRIDISLSTDIKFIIQYLFEKIMEQSIRVRNLLNITNDIRLSDCIFCFARKSSSSISNASLFLTDFCLLLLFFYINLLRNITFIFSSFFFFCLIKVSSVWTLSSITLFSKEISYRGWTWRLKCHYRWPVPTLCSW